VVSEGGYNDFTINRTKNCRHSDCRRFLFEEGAVSGERKVISHMTKRTLRVMMIGAHPDDCELSTGGIAVKYRRKGHVVRFVSATLGDAGHHEMSGASLAHRRAEEFRRAADLTGIDTEILDNRDYGLEPDLKTREKFIAIIRKFKPDLIFTHRPNDYHPDHRYTSILVQDSSYGLIVPNVVPLVEPLSSMPVILYMNDNFKRPNEIRPDIVVDIDEVIGTKIEMIHRHTSQMYEWLPWTDGRLDSVPQGEEERVQWLTERVTRRSGQAAERFRARLIQTYGEERGRAIRNAEAYEISEYGRQPTAEEWEELFPVE
jgi:N-acetylglucosamine malate deacetylase 1